MVFGAGRDRWVSFKYERLPNFRYWCGLLSHDVKDLIDGLVVMALWRLILRNLRIVRELIFSIL